METIHGTQHLGSDLQISAAGRIKSVCNIFPMTSLQQTVREVFQLPISSGPESPFPPVAVPLPPFKIAASKILLLWHSATSYSFGRTFLLCLTCLTLEAYRFTQAR